MPKSRGPRQSDKSHANKDDTPLGDVTELLAASSAEQSDGARLVIVGVGASAGGLDGLKDFLAHLTDTHELAVVIVQHSSGQGNALLVEILSKATRARVTQAVDGARVASGTIYVAPPHTNVAIAAETFELQEAGSKGIMPIDMFFQSLAAGQRERSVGIILSGTGSDGTLGSQAIREYGGATFAQAPTTAKFGDMPQSAIDAGHIDAVGDCKQLAEKTMAYRTTVLRHGAKINEDDADGEDDEVGENSNVLQDIFSWLRARSGNDFSLYKLNTVRRRIRRRMNIRQVSSIEAYEEQLRDDPQETEALFRELLIGVTRFFRDPEAWKLLEEQALPSLFAMRPRGALLRAWVAGCSTGEEAYSLAIAFKEAAERLKPRQRPRLQIFATDIDNFAVDRARVGVYPDSIAADMSADRLDRYFVRDHGRYRISREIREMVVFAPQNIAKHPPFTKVDILTCRNLLIYLSLELQQRILSLFHYSLTPGGVLFLGSAETTGSASQLFDPIESRARLYRATSLAVNTKVFFDFAPDTHVRWRQGEEERRSSPAAVSEANLQPLVDRAIVQRLPWSGVLCNENGSILYISGSVGEFFEPPAGRPSSSVFDMAREGLRHGLIKAFQELKRSRDGVELKGLRVGIGDRGIVADVRVERITAPSELKQSILILVAHSADPAAAPRKPPASKKKPQASSALKADVERLSAELQATREAMQTSEEELKSSNEELQSTNEELQSMNEELMTSKEEMQSLNEELQVVNQELQAKNDELSRFSNDMKNLLNSTDIATLFLDSKLNVRRFTNSATKIVKLIPTDVGRPITDIACDLDYPALQKDALQVLSSLIFKETQVHTHDGRSYVVRIMPYRTFENVIDGVVITFVKTSQAAGAGPARDPVAAPSPAAIDTRILDLFPNPMWTCASDGICNFVNAAWKRLTNFAERLEGRCCWLDSVHVDDKAEVTELWQAAVRRGEKVKTSFRLRSADGTYIWCYCNLAPVAQSPGETLWYGSCTDVSMLMNSARTAEVNVGEQILALLEDAREPVVCLDSDLHVFGANQAAEALLTTTRQEARFQHIETVLHNAREAQLLEALRALGNSYSCTAVAYAGPDGAAYQVQVLTCGVPLNGVTLLFKHQKVGKSA